MTPNAALSLVVASGGGLLAALVWAMGRNTGWPLLQRGAAVVGSAALYCLCNVVATLPVAPSVIVVGSHLNLFFASLHLWSWTGFLPVHDGRPQRSPGEQRLGMVMLVCAAASLVPGVVMDGTTASFPVPWLGVVEQVGASTPAGTLVMVLQTLSLAWLAWDRRARRHSSPQGLAYGVALVAVLLGGVWDMAVSLGLLQQPFLLDLAFLVLVAAVSRTLLSYVGRTTLQLETLRGRLEEAVAQRTRQLHQAQDALVASETHAALGRVAAGVAHEINNPLAAIRGNLEFLQMSQVDASVPTAERLAALSDVLGSVDRIARVVRSLMDAGRGSGRVLPQLEVISLAECVELAVATANSVSAPGVHTNVDVPPDLLVRAHQGTLVQILSNVLINAHQANQRAGRHPAQVRLTAVVTGGSVHVDVQDDGTGIPLAAQKRLFEPFFTTAQPGQGIGLGLAVAQGLAHVLHAQLQLLASSQVGTTMRLTLPVAPHPAAAESPVPDHPARHHTPLRVLAVDDEPDMLRALRRLLSDHEVTLCSGVDQALDHLARKDVDFILCDVMMPDGGGERMYAALAAHHPHLLERLAFITGGATHEGSRAFLQRANRPVLDKPIARETLSSLFSAVTRLSDSRVGVLAAAGGASTSSGPWRAASA